MNLEEFRKALSSDATEVDIIVNDYNVDGACKVLEALGYSLLYREY